MSSYVHHFVIKENFEEYYGECQWLIDKGRDDVKLKNGIHNTVVPHNEVGEEKEFIQFWKYLVLF